MHEPGGKHSRDEAVTNLDAQVDDLVQGAAAASNGRAAHLLFGGPGSAMTQTVIAMRQGAVLQDHESPAEATLVVLRGRVRVTDGTDPRVEGGQGDLLVIPPQRHGLEALTDAAVLLTAVKVSSAG